MKRLIIIICVFYTSVLLSNNFAHYTKTTPLKDTSKCNYKIFYYDNGKIKEEGCLVKGKKEGVWKTYNENGGLIFEFNYKNNLKDGVYKNFFTNGKIRAIGNYYKGNLSGIVKSFDEKGTLLSESEWIIEKNGKSTMKSQKFYNINSKPDGTQELIEGKKYVWIQGQLIPIDR